MIAAQLVACHNASMECYRRAMIGEQTFEGWRENLSQANKLSRSYAMLLDVLNRYRGKGQQKVTVELLRRVTETPTSPMQSKLPMHLSRRAGGQSSNRLPLLVRAPHRTDAYSGQRR
jgi:hypothetical protein